MTEKGLELVITQSASCQPWTPGVEPGHQTGVGCGPGCLPALASHRVPGEPMGPGPRQPKVPGPRHQLQGWMLSMIPSTYKPI